MKLICLIVIVNIIVFARVNPFTQFSDIDKMASITPTEDIFLEKEIIELPSESRVVKEISIKYQSLNGGIYTQKLTLNKKLDWHHPITITHINKTPKIIELKKKKVKKTKQLKKKKSYKLEKRLLKPFRFMSLSSDGNILNIITKDKLVRSFTVPKPYKIVLDFTRKTSFGKKRVKALSLPFKKFFFGQHRDYYRLVIILDGFYKFKIKKSEKGYKLILQ